MRNVDLRLGDCRDILTELDANALNEVGEDILAAAAKAES
ncbi:hypothetical protein SEA_MICHLEY_61 [Mycobacterium phage Michley]|nr:hypothetical protein SEA_MICHLEY_61 [Mycobacterium phage Michley]